MDSSTLPPLLGTYLPNYEEDHMKHMAGDVAPSDSDKEDTVVDFEGERKSKTSRAQLAHKRQMEAEEKAYKEKEEKALHMLKMWNMVKDNERKRKHRLLKDKIHLQHDLIKKQDKLHEILMEQQLREEKEKLQSPRAKFEAFEKLEKPDLKPQRKRTQAKTNKTDTRSLDELNSVEKQAQQIPMHDEKPSPILEDDVLSEEDLSEFVDNTMEGVDFYELRQQSIKVQLEHLLGDNAEIYLNPTVKENPRKGPNPALAKTKGYHGATVLWETLRDFSRQKLRNKDALILPDVKNAYACFTRECLRRHVTPVKRNFVSEEEKPISMDLEESDLLKDVRFRRHRQELMFRIAHINKEKTRLLLQNSGPHYVNNMKTNEGLRRFHPQLSLQNENDIKLPSITVDDTQPVPQLVCLSNNPTGTKPNIPYSQGTKLVFLTEAKATCKGQFAKRLGKNTEDTRVQTNQTNNSEKARTKNPDLRHTVYEPLTMEALFNQTMSSFERQGNGRLVQNVQPKIQT